MMREKFRYFYKYKHNTSNTLFYSLEILTQLTIVLYNQFDSSANLSQEKQSPLEQDNIMEVSLYINQIIVRTFLNQIIVTAFKTYSFVINYSGHFGDV